MTPTFNVHDRLRDNATGIEGKVVSNYKWQGDICVEWADGTRSSYDADVLAEMATLIEAAEVAT